MVRNVASSPLAPPSTAAAAAAVATAAVAGGRCGGDGCRGGLERPLGGERPGDRPGDRGGERPGDRGRGATAGGGLAGRLGPAGGLGCSAGGDPKCRFCSPDGTETYASSIPCPLVTPAARLPCLHFCLLFISPRQDGASGPQ